MRRLCSRALVLSALLSFSCQARDGEPAGLDTEARSADATDAQPGEPYVIPTRPLPAVTGPYAVGTRQLYFVDESRDEAFTREPDDHRRLLVQLWYPTDSTDETRSRYIVTPEEFRGVPEIESVLHVETGAIPDAGLAPGGPFPLLLFHHGGGWTRFSSSFLTEDLASHGYVVASVDHPGFNKTVLFPDGFELVLDGLPFPEETGDLETDARAFWAHLDAHHFPAWLDDSSFVLTRLLEKSADPGDGLHGFVDPEHIGALGWSFGGATSVQASRDDPRIRAAADLDGQLFGDIDETGTAVPLMLLHSDQSSTGGDEDVDAAVLARLIDEVRSRDLALLERSAAETYDFEIVGSHHGSFSDLVLFSPEPDEGHSEDGALTPQRGHELVRALVLAFFDRHLRGRDTSPHRIAEAAPEVRNARPSAAR